MLTDLPDSKLALFSVFSQLSFDQNTRQHRHSLSKGEGCTGEYLYYLSIFIHSSSKGEPSSKLVNKIPNCPRRTLEKPWSGTCRAPAAFRPVQPAMRPAILAEVYVSEQSIPR